MIFYLFQAIDILEKKNSNSVSFHEILKAGKNIWMRNCACYYWIFLNAAFTVTAIIVWKILIFFLKKTNYSDFDVILKKKLNCSFFCWADFFCVEIEMRECYIYNDLSLSRLEINENFWFTTSEIDETFIDNWILNKNWSNCEIFIDWWIIFSYSDDDCLTTLNKKLLKFLSRWIFW